MATSIGTETVDLSLRLLDFLAQSKESVGVSELARQFQASKATLYRHLRTLAHHGFVRQDEATQRYGAGIKLFILGERLRERFDVLAVARGEMTRLRDETAHAATLTALVDHQAGPGPDPGTFDRQLRHAARHRARLACERARKGRARVRP
jgi:DNA-binding IclR family transcriptional regulator